MQDSHMHELPATSDDQSHVVTATVRDVPPMTDFDTAATMVMTNDDTILNNAATIVTAKTGQSERDVAVLTPSPAREVSDNWPPRCFAEQHVPVRQILRSGLLVTEVTYVTIGAGMGSFAFADMLRISGIKPDHIVAIGPNPKPHGHYGVLTRNSQIPAHERIRSNSESTPDNIWGWPGYALREVTREVVTGHIGNAAGIALQIFGEPTLADTYTPKIGNVFRAVEREAERIGWERMYRYGRVVAIRKTDDGRYAIAYSTRSARDEGVHAIILANYVHMAMGYPTITFLPDLQRYREQTGDSHSVVNAYEDHDYIYDYVRTHGGTVLIRGRGIVASRILQRLYEERTLNPNISVIHLIRSPLSEGYRYGRAQRPVINHFEHQPFNWPRSCWGGVYRKKLERATPEERKRLLSEWGGTTTAQRKDWVNLVKRGLREGWYQQAFGEVETIDRGNDGKLITVVKTKGHISGSFRYAADFIIDATGLDARAMINPVLQDMMGHYSLALNPLQRLHVENDFEIPGMCNGQGRMYAAGAMTLGGPNAGVDTFLGLQYAAWRAVDSLHRLRAPGIRKIRGIRSLTEWLKWVGGIKP